MNALALVLRLLIWGDEPWEVHECLALDQRSLPPSLLHSDLQQPSNSSSLVTVAAAERQQRSSPTTGGGYSSSTLRAQS